jgi:hypothetical protein
MDSIMKPKVINEADLTEEIIRQQAEIKKLMAALSDISQMCIGQIAMNIPLDAEYIGQVIYEASGLTSPELLEQSK